MVKIIGFTGQMGVGKSTAIETLRHYTDIPVHNVKFAQPLYDMQEFIYRRIQWAYKKPDNFVKDRKLLQWLGTDWGRDTISETLWIDIWQQEVQSYLDLSKQFNGKKMIVVCDDVRFNNEAEMLKSIGGTLIQLTSDRTNDRINTKAGITNHKSESGVDAKYIDYTISNNNSLAEYAGALQDLFGTLNLKTLK